MGRPPLRLGRPKGRPQAPFQPSHENRYPFTNWSTFAPPKWSKFTPPLTREITLSAVNQLWVAAITYIRLRREFVYLAVPWDAYSRRVMGWALGRTLQAELTLSALRMALRQRQPAPGLTHHSDRGVPYVSAAYTDGLQQYRITSSMSRKANPYDNAQAESFMKTLK